MPTARGNSISKGRASWVWHSYNANQVAFTSGIWVMMTQTLVPTQRINDGAYYGTEFRLPKGTWMNPDDRRTGHAYAWHFLVSGWSALWRALSHGYFSRGYLEEVNSGNANTANWLQGGGINQEGEVHAVNSFESAACGTGACAAAVAAISQGWMDSPLQIELPGGKLSIEWAGPGQPVMMTGPAVRVYEGQVRL